MPTAKKIEPKSKPVTENMLINESMKLAYKQIKEGKASPSTINMYLKMQADREKLELEKQILVAQKDLVEAKAKAIEDDSKDKASIDEVKDALSKYRGNLPQ
jgi:hypothetical protein